MMDGFASIITQLERRKTAIDRALTALRDVEGIETPAPVVSAPEAPTGKRKQFSAASRRKMALAQKARWAKIKGESEPVPATPEPPTAKRKISAEGLQRIIAATKKRWHLKRAAALAKKAA
jgi:hypothetical protein